MPTIYIRTPGSRRYIDYTKEQLQQCLSDVRSKMLTQREAALKYKIPRSTIKNKLKNKHCNKPGHPTIFTTEEEEAFVAHITALSEYGFPITDIDLKIIIKNYLFSSGRQVKQFKHNVPGIEWVRGFLNRNKTLSRRLANNIKKVRAAISEQIIKDFIDLIPGPSGLSQTNDKKKGKIRKRFIHRSSSSESSDAEISLASSSEDLITARDQPDDSEDDLPLTQLTNPDNSPAPDESLAQFSKSLPLLRYVQSNAQSCNVGVEAVIEEECQDGNDYCVGDHVLVKWDSRVYPGKIISQFEEGALVSCMKRGKFWRWPAIKDEQLYRWEAVIKKINVPKSVKKGLFIVPEIDLIMDT